MKGGIELTQGAVVYLIIMLLVIILGLAIATQGKFTILFNKDKLGQLSDTSVVSMEGKLAAACTTTGTFTFANTIRIENAQLHANDPKDNTVDFFLILELDDKLALGHPEGSDVNTPYKYTCNKPSEDGKFECGGEHTILFELNNPPQADQILVHITAWRATPGMQLAVKSIGSQNFRSLLDSQFYDYLGSVGIKGDLTLDQLCKQHLCEVYTANKDKDACVSSKTCYWVDGYFGDECKSCPARSLCTGLPKEACVPDGCDTSEFEPDGCTWDGGFLGFGAACKSNAASRTCNTITDQDSCNSYKILDKNYCYYDKTSTTCKPCPSATTCSDYGSDKDLCETCSSGGCKLEAIDTGVTSGQIFTYECVMR